MARGWESKAVEEQINERETENLNSDIEAARLSKEERVKQSRLSSLRLSRVRIVNQLTAATNPIHRTMLESALAALDNQISDLSKTV